ncbi:MAG: transposase family protein [Deltaproteobacteria bacterium]|nr:transposase family protein [Deltaproteobacteria bacterium]
MSYTERYERSVYQRVRRESVSQVAQDEGLSEEAVQAIFEQRAKKRRRHAGTHK